MTNTIYKMSEDYKLGWIRGFYGCGRDEGSRMSMYSAAASDAIADHAIGQYTQGYQDGLAARRSGIVVSRYVRLPKQAASRRRKRL